MAELFKLSWSHAESRWRMFLFFFQNIHRCSLLTKTEFFASIDCSIYNVFVMQTVSVFVLAVWSLVCMSDFFVSKMIVAYVTTLLIHKACECACA